MTDEWFKRFLTLFFFLVLVSCPVSGASDWPTFRHDVKRSGYSNAKFGLVWSDIVQLWNYTTGSRVRSSPAVGDINSDGFQEIVVGSNDRNIYALDHRGNVLWSYATEGYVSSSPTMCNLSGTGFLDVVVGSEDGRVYALDYQGRMLWSFKTNGSVKSSPAVADLDGDLELEVVFGSDDGNVYALDPNGVIKWIYKTAESVESSPAVADITSDGKMDVVVGSTDNIVYAIADSATKVWMYRTNGDVTSTPAIFGDIAIGSSDKSIYSLYYHSYGGESEETRKCTTENGVVKCTRAGFSYTTISPRWNYTTNDEIMSSPAVADVNRDGRTEVVVGSNDKVLYIIDSTGKKILRYTTNKAVKSSPAILDLDGNGVPEIVFGSDDYYLYVIDYTGMSKWNYRTNGSVESSPALADLEGDGSPEIVVGSDDGSVYVFGSRSASRKQDADAIYRKAFNYYNVGDMGNATEYFNQARGIYAEINYASDVKKVDLMLKIIQAEDFYIKAMDSLNKGDLNDTIKYAQGAESLYNELNNSEGISKANELIYNATVYLEANGIYLTAEEYFNKSELEKAISYANKAKETYAKVNYAEGVSKCDLILGKAMSNIGGNTYYLKSDESYKMGDFENASIYAYKAREQYMNANFTDYALKSEIILNKSVTHVQAKELYTKAEQYYTEGDYTSAIEYAETARELYMLVDDQTGVLKSNYLVNNSIVRMQSSSPKSGGALSFDNPVFRVAVGALIVFLLIVMVRYGGGVKDSESKTEEEEEQDKGWLASRGKKDFGALLKEGEGMDSVEFTFNEESLKKMIEHKKDEGGLQ